MNKTGDLLPDFASIFLLTFKFLLIVLKLYTLKKKDGFKLLRSVCILHWNHLLQIVKNQRLKHQPLQVFPYH